MHFPRRYIEHGTCRQLKIGEIASLTVSPSFESSPLPEQATQYYSAPMVQQPIQGQFPHLSTLSTKEWERNDKQLLTIAPNQTITWSSKCDRLAV